MKYRREVRTTGRPWHPRRWAREREQQHTSLSLCSMSGTLPQPRASHHESENQERSVLGPFGTHGQKGLAYSTRSPPWLGLAAHAFHGCAQVQSWSAMDAQVPLSLLYGLGSGQSPQNRHASSNTTYKPTRTKALSARQKEKERQLRVGERERKPSRSTM